MCDRAWVQCMQPCLLYLNKKFAPEFLFVAAASLHALTGKTLYRADADTMWPMGPQSVEQQTFLYNWNNILIQGAVILAMQPDVPGAARNRDFYRRALRSSVALWSQCSNQGEAIINYYTFCECVPHPDCNEHLALVPSHQQTARLLTPVRATWFERAMSLRHPPPIAVHLCQPNAIGCLAARRTDTANLQAGCMHTPAL